MALGDAWAVGTAQDGHWNLVSESWGEDAPPLLVGGRTAPDRDSMAMLCIDDMALFQKLPIKNKKTSLSISIYIVNSGSVAFASSAPH